MEQVKPTSSYSSSKLALAFLAIAAVLLLTRCGVGGGPSSSPPPPQPTITVTVSPATATLLLGQQQQFTATVTGAANSAVTWQVDGTPGGDTTNGAINTQGLYTAPSSLPSNPAITVRAVSQADSTASGSATVTLTTGIQVSLSPPSASVTVNSTQQFTAQVAGAASESTAVNWSLTGGACPSSCGSLSTNGNSATYTAPPVVPSPATVSITATSVADPTKSTAAIVTIVSGACSPAISISPSSTTVALGGQQNFSATLCLGGDHSVTWSINTPGCGVANCGTVTTTGADSATYTAPASAPSANPITLVATSVADPAQSASAAITIILSCAQPISISPSAATAGLGQQIPFSATVCFTTNQTVTWSITGAGCLGSLCGSVSSTGANTASYTAPSALPPANPLTLVATSIADSTKSADATITISSGVSVAIVPQTVELAVGRRASFTAAVQGVGDQSVAWSVNGVANGNSTVGQICVAGSNPCSAPTAAASGAVVYLAPASVPSPSTVAITATSAADSGASGTAAATILPHLSLSIWPVNAVVAPSGTVEFAVTVIGSPNSSVNWKTVCSSSSCGSITASGVYTAPAAAVSPNQFTITATSQDDSTQSATATVALTSAVAISQLAPASVTAGASTSFLVRLTGYNFSPSPSGAAVLVNGASRAATCASATLCAITLQPGDVASPGNLSIQAQNPDGSRSNTLSLVAVPPDSAIDVISLTSSAPVAGGKDILAVEPTSAGDPSNPGPMAVLFIGIVDPASGACNVHLGPVAIARPASGSSTITFCAAGNALNASSRIVVVGSQSTDASISAIGSAGGSLVQFNLTISSSMAPGLLTLVFTDGNQNLATASGAIDVE